MFTSTLKRYLTLRKDTTEITFSMESAGGNDYAVSWDSDGRGAGTYAVDFNAKDIAGNIGELLNANSICMLAAVAADFDSDGDVDQDDYDLIGSTFRVVVKRQLVQASQGQELLYADYVYRFIITNIPRREMNAAEVLWAATRRPGLGCTS